MQQRHGCLYLSLPAAEPQAGTSGFVIRKVAPSALLQHRLSNRRAAKTPGTGSNVPLAEALAFLHYAKLANDFRYEVATDHTFCVSTNFGNLSVRVR